MNQTLLKLRKQVPSQADMKAIILCAKKKENLFPFTETTPTGLLPVGGTPNVRRLIDDLEAAGVDEFYLITNHLERKYKEEFENDKEVSIVHQEEVTGTADALENCGDIEEDFYVVNGDVMVSRNDLKCLKKKHLNERPEATVLGDSEEKPEKFGVLSILNDEVKSIVEKPEAAENSLVNTGVYVFRPSIFGYIESSNSSSLAEVVGDIAENQKVKMSVIEDYWMEIDSLRRLWKADRFIREKTVENEVADSAEVHDSAEIRGRVEVRENAVIRENSTVEGPTVIGEKAVIGPNTAVHKATIGEGSQLRSATVENSFIFDEAIVDPHVHVEQSVLGEGADVKSGTSIYESFIGAESFIEMNNSIKGTKFVPDARTDLGEISK